MEEKETEGLEESLKGYKEKIPLESRAFLTWEKGVVFTGRMRGCMVDYDPLFIYSTIISQALGTAASTVVDNPCFISSGIFST